MFTSRKCKVPIPGFRPDACQRYKKRLQVVLLEDAAGSYALHPRGDRLCGDCMASRP